MDKRIVIIASLLVIIAIVVAVMMKSKSGSTSASVESKPTVAAPTVAAPIVAPKPTVTAPIVAPKPTVVAIVAPKPTVAAPTVAAPIVAPKSTVTVPIVAPKPTVVAIVAPKPAAAPTSKKISVTWNAGVEASPTWISATINYPASDKGVLAPDSGERVFVDGQYKQLLIQKVTALNASGDNPTASIGVTPIISNQPAWSTSSTSNPVTIDLTKVGNLLIPTLSNNYYANNTSITIEGTVS